MCDPSHRMGLTLKKGRFKHASNTRPIGALRNVSCRPKSICTQSNVLLVTCWWSLDYSGMVTGVGIQEGFQLEEEDELAKKKAENTRHRRLF